MDRGMVKPEVWQIVSIVTCMLLITTFLATVTRLATKYAMYKKLYLDDLFATIAMVRLSLIPYGVCKVKLTYTNHEALLHRFGIISLDRSQTWTGPVCPRDIVP